MARYEALYGWRCRSLFGWFEVSKAGLIDPELVHQAMEKVKVIQEGLKTAQSHQKSFTDVRRRALEFEIKDWADLWIIWSHFKRVRVRVRVRVLEGRGEEEEKREEEAKIRQDRRGFRRG
ncbi:hypothetical protein MTR67_021996 [Solanum verrucosum]|uniref:Uncharacterized protein n=1 Tax=Solanum verrucosum TaxID=315347 RepID=A0AAF0TQD6_SOLVR|nr:hypothetical protein MTR67_021996 [Solanum verrucosum]